MCWQAEHVADAERSSKRFGLVVILAREQEEREGWGLVPQGLASKACH